MPQLLIFLNASLRAAACVVVVASLRSAACCVGDGGRSPFSPCGLASLCSLPARGGSLWFPLWVSVAVRLFPRGLASLCSLPTRGSLWFPLRVSVAVRPFPRAVLRRFAPCPHAGALFGFLLWVLAVRPFPTRSCVALLLARAGALFSYLCGCHHLLHGKPLACHVCVCYLILTVKACVSSQTSKSRPIHVTAFTGFKVRTLSITLK